MGLTELEKYVYEENGNLYWKINKGRRAKIGDLIGTISNKNYLRFEINNKQYVVHRVLYQIYHRIEHLDTSIQIDHINRDKLNNNKENLRICNTSQNKMNSNKYSTNSSGYKNLTYSRFIDKRNGNIKEYWTVYVSANKKKYCKRFPYTEEGKISALCYREYIVKKLHKEFHNL